MEKKIIFMIMLVVLSFSIDSMAQKKDRVLTNCVNSEGKKEGLWINIDKNEAFKYFKYYRNGTLDGVCYSISVSRNTLDGFGQYSNGEYTGTWYYFGDNGELIMIQKDFKKNDKPTPAVHHASGVRPYQCYCISYYPNGNKESEGILLWNEGPELDTSFEDGVWKYYDETGKLIRTKEYR